MNNNIGLENIILAYEFWASNGFHSQSVPMSVDKDILLWTTPEDRQKLFSDEHNDKYYVASAEQSFLQLEKEGKLAYHDLMPPTCLMGLTQCVRDEPVLDDTHFKSFVKLELFIYNGIPEDVLRLAKKSQMFLEVWLGLDNVRIIKTDNGLDIVAQVKGKEIELGSYGCRESPKGVSYVYGTGLAEPRTSYVQQLLTKGY